MVKECMFEDTPFFEKNSKFKAFAKDIREIIQKQIEYSEIIDMPYSQGMATCDLERNARRVLIDEYWKLKAHQPETSDLFKISRRKEEDKVHYYVYFAVEAWRKMLNE